MSISIVNYFYEIVKNDISATCSITLPFMPVTLLFSIFYTGGWSTAASTHVIGLLPVSYTHPYVEIVITTSELDPVNFTVSSLNEILYTGNVTAGTPTNITDNNGILTSYIVGSKSERNKGILVTTGSQKKILITVAIVEYIGSAGVYLNYPAWGYPVDIYVYYAVSIGTRFINNTFSSLLIVSANDNTNITITPSVTVTIPSDLSPTGIDTILNPGQSITIQLQYLQTLLIKPVILANDLTGTKVESNKPISVYSGHTCGHIPTRQCCCDFVGEQLPPVASWGNKFLVQSFYNRPSGYILKLVGSQDDTSVSISCYKSRDYSLLLQEGDVLSQNITQTSCYINSTKPILVAQFMMGRSTDKNITGNYSDPAMTIIPPLHHYTNNATSFPLITLFQNIAEFVNLAVLAGSDSSQIRLNGKLLPSLSSSSWKHYDSSSSVYGYYFFDTYKLTDIGEISVWSDNYNDKIAAMVYGMILYSGYSYAGKLNLKPFGGMMSAKYL